MAELTAVRADDGSWTFDLEAVTAAAEAIPASPPREWFERREFDGPTPLTFDENGAVYGHIADRSVPHIGLPGNIGAPKSRTDYKWYRTGQVRCADGSLVSTGRITMATSHADLQADASRAQDHYDQSGAAVADVVAWDDEWGVAVAGAARPGLTAEQMRMAMASPPSGDWRSVAGSGLELVACLLVSVPGYPVPRANLAASGAPMALVAAGVVTRDSSPVPAPAATPQAPKPKTPDLSRVRTPEELVAMTDTTNPEPTEDDDESLAAAGNPFAKGEDSGDDSDEAPMGDYESGDTVLFTAPDRFPFQVSGTTDDGKVVIEAVVDSDQLEQADEAMAAAAYSQLGEWQQDRVRDANAKRMATEQKQTSEQLATVTAALTSVTAKLEAMEADKRAETARELLASAGIE